MDTELTYLSATRLARLIRDKRVSSREVVAAHLIRIEDVNPRLNGVVQLDAEGARAAATAADDATVRGEARGPLHGVPFTVKDWIETEGIICAAGFEERRDYVPKRDATAVARMRAAGAVLLGKTKCGATADVYPAARNPYDLTRTPGGSSAGDAAIVAAGGSPLGIASDSGGSIRWPAHCCGVAALKPTSGFVPLTGHFPRIYAMSDPRTAIGPMARSAEDLLLALRVMAGPDPGDASVVPMPVGDAGAVELRGLRVAWYTRMPGATPSAATVATVEAAAKALADAGADVREARPPRLEESLPITEAYWARPSSMSLAQWRPHGSSRATGDDIERHLFEWDRFRRFMLLFMEDFDLILCPVAEDVAPPAAEPVTAQHYIYTLPYSLTGWPVAVVRCGASAEGLPVAVQAVARPWHDHVAVAAAQTLESALGGWKAPRGEEESVKGT